MLYHSILHYIKIDYSYYWCRASRSWAGSRGAAPSWGPSSGPRNNNDNKENKANNDNNNDTNHTNNISHISMLMLLLLVLSTYSIYV